MKKNKIIGFIGDGWGAVAAVKSLKKNFKLHYLTNDKHVIDELISQKQNTKVNKIDKLSNKIIVVAGYTSIIKSELIQNTTLINIHYSLLPKYRGLHSTAWEIINGEPELGVTIHLMTSFIDDGPIIFQKAFKNDNVSTANDFMKIKNNFIANNLGDIILKYLNNEIRTIEQDKSKASWVGKRSYKHNLIDFNQDSDYTKRLFRVLTPPYPYPLIIYNGLNYVVKEFKFHYSSIKTDLGRILNVDDEGVWVKNKDGYLILKNINSEKNEFVPYSHFKIGNYLNNHDRS